MHVLCFDPVAGNNVNCIIQDGNQIGRWNAGGGLHLVDVSLRHVREQRNDCLNLNLRQRKRRLVRLEIPEEDFTCTCSSVKLFLLFAIHLLRHLRDESSTIKTEYTMRANVATSEIRVLVLASVGGELRFDNARFACEVAALLARRSDELRIRALLRELFAPFRAHGRRLRDLLL